MGALRGQPTADPDAVEAALPRSSLQRTSAAASATPGGSSTTLISDNYGVLD